MWQHQKRGHRTAVICAALHRYGHRKTLLVIPCLKIVHILFIGRVFECWQLFNYTRYRYNVVRVRWLTTY